MNTEITAEQLDKFSNPAGVEYDLGVVRIKFSFFYYFIILLLFFFYWKVLKIKLGRGVQRLQDSCGKLLQRIRTIFLGVRHIFFASQFFYFIIFYYIFLIRIALVYFINFFIFFFFQTKSQGTFASKRFRVHVHNYRRRIYQAPPRGGCRVGGEQPLYSE